MSAIDYHDILRQADAVFPSDLDHAASIEQQQDREQMVTLEDDHIDGQHLRSQDMEGEEEFVVMEDQHHMDHSQEVQNIQEQVMEHQTLQSHQQQEDLHGQSQNHVQTQSPTGPSTSGRIKGLTAAEKKERQRAQNRKAAEKSRNKKKGEQMALELSVANMQEENQRLRAKLQTLLASRPPDSPVEPASSSVDPLLSSSSTSIIPATVTGTGIDYMYIAKLQNELTSAKAILFERCLEHSRLKKGSQDFVEDPQRSLKIDMVSNLTKVVGLQAEMAGLQTVLGHLNIEKDGLEQQREKVEKEVNGNKAVRDAIAVARRIAEQENAQRALQAQNVERAASVPHMPLENEHQSALPESTQQTPEGDDGNRDGAGVDKALLDIRGWIDAAVKGWDQNLPESQEKEGSS
ncbi:hypothetical protein I308_105108 [Cryptococcus tetragattii IND107]|uniref:BZIP domain-containing protein n=1 Tax=Cryptococcus tetragattii IND107 TaxID=1296105 RepID=A0ABR3BQG1_9TREE|nr:hypothetical protein I308_01959 [Cryptococcus tetragattii IND107]